MRKEGTGEQEAILSLIKKEEVELQKQYEEIILRIANSGYANLEAELAAVNETLEHLQTSQGKWQQISERLEAWKEQDVVSNQMLWDMEKFTKGTIMAEELERLQESFGEVREELEEQRQEATDVAPQSEERRERGKRRVKRAETGKESLSERAGGSKI